MFQFSDLISPVSYDASHLFIKKIEGHFFLFENGKFLSAFASESDAIAVKNGLVASINASNKKWERIWENIESNCYE